MNFLIDLQHSTQPFALSATAPLEIIEATIRREDSTLKKHTVKKNKFYYNAVRGT